MTVEPFGPVQEDLRAGVVASVMARSQGAKVDPSDLFQSLGPVPARGGRRAQTLAEMKAVARRIARLTGGA